MNLIQLIVQCLITFSLLMAGTANAARIFNPSDDLSDLQRLLPTGTTSCVGGTIKADFQLRHPSLGEVSITKDDGSLVQCKFNTGELKLKDTSDSGDYVKIWNSIQKIDPENLPEEIRGCLVQVQETIHNEASERSMFSITIHDFETNEELQCLFGGLLFPGN